jgi:hypothetical protein
MKSQLPLAVISPPWKGIRNSMFFREQKNKHCWSVYHFNTYEQAREFAQAQEYLTVVRLGPDDSWQVWVSLYIKIYRN